MKVGMLKDLLKPIPDDYDIVVIAKELNWAKEDIFMEHNKLTDIAFLGDDDEKEVHLIPCKKEEL